MAYSYSLVFFYLTERHNYIHHVLRLYGTIVAINEDKCKLKPKYLHRFKNCYILQNIIKKNVFNIFWRGKNYKRPSGIRTYLVKSMINF